MQTTSETILEKRDMIRHDHLVLYLKLDEAPEEVRTQRVQEIGWPRVDDAISSETGAAKTLYLFEKISNSISKSSIKRLQ